MNLLNGLISNTKLNPKALKLKRIHPSFLKIIKQAPKIKKGDYQKVFAVVQTWFNAKIFKYSMLDRFNQKGGKLVTDGQKIYFYGNYSSCDLRYTSGICYSLACNLKYILNICYPWFDVALVENLNWKKTGNNHCYLLFPTEGFNYSDTGKLFSNNSFVGQQPFQKNFNFRGKIFALDPCENVITEALNNDYLVIGRNILHRLILPYGSFSDAENITNYRQHRSFVYSENTFGDSAIQIGHSSAIDYSLIWILKHNGITTNYDFYDSNFLNRVKEVYPRIYPDFLTLVKRGYTVVK